MKLAFKIALGMAILWPIAAALLAVLTGVMSASQFLNLFQTVASCSKALQPN